MPEIQDKTDFDTVIRKHVWKLTAIGAVIGAVLIIGILSAYSLAGRSLFCGSCHSMEKNYFTWKASRHKQFPCIECHIPAGPAAYAVLYKGYAGFRDVMSETARSYPFTITLTHHARDIANTNCSRCHFSTIENTSMRKGDTDCIGCHRFLVHGRPMGNGGISY